MKLVKVIICTIFVSFIFAISSTVKAASLLSNLEIEGIGSLGISSKTTFDLAFSTSMDYVTITATPAGDGITVTGTGQVSITEGANSLVVTATNGSQSETYTINLNVTKKSGGSVVATSTASYDKDATDVKNPNTGAFISFPLIAIAIGASAITIIKQIRKNRFYNI